jgi:hypothetical protein
MTEGNDGPRLLLLSVAVALGGVAVIAAVLGLAWVLF